MPYKDLKASDKPADPRVQRTRKLIEQAFIELIRERGFQSITIQDITGRATLNRATFYAHFEDKFDMLDHFIRAQFHEALLTKIPDYPEYTHQRLILLIVTVIEFVLTIRTHCEPADRQIEAMFETAVQEELYLYLADWMDHAPKGIVPLEVTTKTAASVWSWAIFGTAIQTSRTETDQTAAQIANQIAQVLVNAQKY